MVGFGVVSPGEVDKVLRSQEVNEKYLRVGP